MYWKLLTNSTIIHILLCKYIYYKPWHTIPLIYTMTTEVNIVNDNNCRTENIKVFDLLNQEIRCRIFSEYLLWLSNVTKHKNAKPLLDRFCWSYKVVLLKTEY